MPPAASLMAVGAVYHHEQWRKGQAGVHYGAVNVNTSVPAAIFTATGGNQPSGFNEGRQGPGKPLSALDFAPSGRGNPRVAQFGECGEKVKIGKNCV